MHICTKNIKIDVRWENMNQIRLELNVDANTKHIYLFTCPAPYVCPYSFSNSLTFQTAANFKASFSSSIGWGSSNDMIP